MQLVRRPWMALGLALVMALAGAAGASPLRVVMEVEPAHLNPLLDPDLWGYRLAHDLVCEPLVRQRPGSGTPEYEPVLAEWFRVEDDGRGIEVQIRRGIRFHDGRPLSHVDVRATLELLRRSASVAPRTHALVAGLRHIWVVAPDRLRIEWEAPAGGLLAALAEIDILPAHHFAQGGLAHQPQNRRPVCTGPYRLHEWRRGSEIVLRRHAGYWGALAPQEELRFLVVPDAARALALVRRGGAEVLGHLPAMYYPEQVEPAMLRGRLRTIEAPANQVTLLLWNGQHPALALPAIRRALSMVVDRPRLVREVRHGLGEPVRLPPPLRSAQLAPDLAAAEALLDGAGAMRLSPGGHRALGGRALRLGLLVPAGASEAQQAAERVAQDCARAGVQVEPEVVALSSLQSRLRRGAFDAALLAWAWTGPWPDLSPLLHSRGAQAYSRSEGPELDAALDRVRRAVGPGQQREALDRLATVLDEQEPVTFLYRARQVVLLDQRVQPHPPPLSGGFPVLRMLHLSGSAPP
ncbi:MAG: ABC transporter substrate-binding protein [Myxococcales bacterium]|nr:ABC transporter substrate-binding protein [Myxococcales bacterium]